MKSDADLIKDLGGPAKVAKLLGYDKPGSVQRVQNWMTRGIPAEVRLAHLDIFPVQDTGAVCAYSGPDHRDSGREVPHVMVAKRSTNGDFGHQ
jgi:hypothetical protein